MKRKSKDQIAAAVSKAQELIKSGVPVRDALKQTGIVSSTWSRHKKAVKKASKPIKSDLLTLQLQDTGNVFLAYGNADTIQGILKSIQAIK